MAPPCCSPFFMIRSDDHAAARSARVAYAIGVVAVAFIWQFVPG